MNLVGDPERPCSDFGNETTAAGVNDGAKDWVSELVELLVVSESESSEIGGTKLKMFANFIFSNAASSK